MNQIDEAFKKTAEEINAKIREATEAMKAANKLAKEAGLKGLISSYYMTKSMDEDEEDLFEEKMDLIKVDEFESELETAGWSTSSSYC